MTLDARARAGVEFPITYGTIYMYNTVRCTYHLFFHKNANAKLQYVHRLQNDAAFYHTRLNIQRM